MAGSEEGVRGETWAPMRAASSERKIVHDEPLSRKKLIAWPETRSNTLRGGREGATDGA